MKHGISLDSEDLQKMTREELIAEVIALQALRSKLYQDLIARDAEHIKLATIKEMLNSSLQFIGEL